MKPTHCRLLTKVYLRFDTRITCVSLLLFAVLALCLSVLPVCSGAGVTIVTHGFTLLPTEPDWVDEMGDAIAARAGEGTAVFRIEITFSGTFVYWESGEVITSSQNTNGEIVIKLFWDDFANGCIFPLVNSSVIADAIVPELLNAILTDNGGHDTPSPPIELPVHLVGHSRGGSVVSELAKMLGKHGVWVDQVSFLDPHPETILDLCPAFVLQAVDADVEVYENVIFADNYYENLFCTYPRGQSVEGTTAIWLNPRFEIDGLNGCLAHDHGHVHDWYHGTIDTNATDVLGNPIPRQFWYQSDDKKGFRLSRLGAGQTLRKLGSPSGNILGLAEWYPGGENNVWNRTPVQRDSTPGSQWPNVVLENQGNRWTNMVGSAFKIQYTHNDADSAYTVSFFTDNDLNPYNTPPQNNFIYLDPQLQTPVGLRSYTQTLSWSPDLTQSGRFLYAKVTDSQSHARYFYLSKPFVVTSTPLPPPPPAQEGNDITMRPTYRWDDRDEDGDGVPEAGERVQMQIQLQNTSPSEVTSVRGVLTNIAGNVEIFGNDVFYGDLGPNESSWSGSEYDYELQFSSTTTVSFKLRADYTKNGIEYYQEETFQVTFYEDGALEPKFEVADIQWNDAGDEGDGDGVVESGEDPGFRICLRNVGNAGATEVRARVTNVKFLSIRDETLEYPDIPTGGQAVCPEGSADFDLDGIIPKSFAGVASADIEVTYSASDIVHTIRDYPLFDVQPAPWIKVEPETYDFGTSSTTQDVQVAWTVRNAGSSSFQVTDLVRSHDDMSWSGDPLPWTLEPGQSKSVWVTVETSGLQGNIEPRQLVATTTARIDDPGKDDRIIITGLVSDSLQTFEIPGVTGARNPDISGEWIVWTDSRNGNDDVFAYNIRSGEELQITYNPASQFQPYISGNLIVWEDPRNQSGANTLDIYAFDLSNPGLGEFLVVAGAGKDDLIGLDGNLVAVVSDYETLLEQTGQPGEIARNLVVYEYEGNAQFTVRYHTMFTPGSGTQTRQTVDDDGDFAEGFLVFARKEWVWDEEHGDWDPADQHVEIIDFAAGETSPRRAIGFPSDFYAAAAHRFVFIDTDTEGIDQLWLWRSDGSIQQLTFWVDAHVVDEVLAIGGPDEHDFVVYDSGDADRPDLYYLDRAAGDVEGVIIADVEASEMRMDGYGVVWRDLQNSSIRFFFFKQTELAVIGSNTALSNESPTENETFEITTIIANLGDTDSTADLTIKLFDGDPDQGGMQLGEDMILSGGIPANAQSQAQFGNVQLTGEGIHQLCIRIYPLDSDNWLNNTACKDVLVVDDDTIGPVVNSLTLAEHAGDGDGEIDSTEQIKAAYTLFDPNGIASNQLLVNDTPVSTSQVNGEYQAIFGPLTGGTHQVEIRSVDQDASPATNVFKTSFLVQSPPNIPPEANCRSITSAASVSCTANVTAADIDNNSTDSDGTIESYLLSPAGPFGLGTTPVTLTVVDDDGASNACVATVTVIDTTPPTLECPANISTSVPPGETDITLNFPAPVTSDACSGVTNHFTPASGSSFGLGTNEVECTAVDEAGNTNSCTFQVIVGITPAADCSLTPSIATNLIGTSHMVTSTVTSNGVAVSGVTVHFSVTAGPNAGESGSDATDANGQSQFSYTGGPAGIDTIMATGMVNSTVFSCSATKVWIEHTASCNLTPLIATNQVGTSHDVDLVLLADGSAASGVTVHFFVSAGPNAGMAETDSTSGSGQASFEYTSNGGTGTDTIMATGIVNGVTFACEVSKVWVDNSCPDLSGVWSRIKSKCKVKKGVLTCKLSGKLEVRNGGDANAGASFVRYYLSDDALFDDGDLLIGEDTIKALAPGKVGKAKLKTALGNNPSGKHIIAVIDAGGNVAECDEDNNTAATGPLP